MDQSDEAFYTPFSRDLKKAAKEMRDVKRQEVPTDIACEKCGAMMVVKWGRNGEFWPARVILNARTPRILGATTTARLQVAKEEQVNETCEQLRQADAAALGQVRQVSRLQWLPGMYQHPAAGKAGGPRHQMSGMQRRQSDRAQVAPGQKSFTAATAIRSASSLMGSPGGGPCPNCNDPILVEKVTKRAGRTRRCRQKECGYSIQVAE